MTTGPSELDRAITGLGQAWLGGITAAQRITERMYGVLHEGAVDEVEMRTTRNATEATIEGPRKATPLTADAATHPKHDSTLQPCQLWLSPGSVPDLGPDDVFTVVVTAYPTPAHHSGTHRGYLRDVAGEVVGGFDLTVSPPPAPADPG